MKKLTVLTLAFLSALVWGRFADAAVAVKRVTSPGGIEAWLVEDHTVPVLALQFAFRGGAALDPKGKDGLAELTGDLLDEGAGDLDSQTFQGRIQDLGAQLSFSSDQDNFQGGVFALTDRRDEVVRSEEHTSELQSH